MRRDGPARRVVVTVSSVLLLSAGCGHEAPFGQPAEGTDRPFQDGALLTLNRLSDRDASWLPDGAGILYTAERDDQPLGDACLALLPPTGGRSTRTICHRGASQLDSVDAVESAAVSPSGRLAYLLVARRPLAIGWSSFRLVVTSLSRPDSQQVVSELPIPGAGHNYASQIRWLDDDRFVYRADQYSMEAPCPGCPLEPVVVGRFVALVELHETTALLHAVLGTQFATSVTTEGDSAVVYTLASSDQVFRHVLATGATSVLFDFGLPVNNAQLAAGRLVVTTDTQGIWWVDLAGGAVQVLSALPFSRLALSPDGRRLVAQTPGTASDLYLFGLP